MASSAASTRLTSATFSPDARFSSAGDAAPDMVLVSADDVLFHVHAAVLRRASANNMAGLVGRASTAATRAPEDAAALTIVLCRIYGLAPPAAATASDWPALARAVAALGPARYALPPLSTGEPLYGALLAHVNRAGGARDVFALAAGSALEPLAVAASAHLLSMDLSTIDDGWARAVGAVYLRRLFFLHLGRVDAFKRIVAAHPPPAHAPTPACGPQQRERDVVLPWVLKGAQLVAVARPDMPSSQIEAVLITVADECPCAECSNGIRARIQALLQEWAAVKRTI